MQTDELTALVVDSLREILSEMDDAERPVLAAIDASTPLYGRDSAINSLTLVSLIVDIEQCLAEEHDVFVTLADDRAMSQARSPFRTIGSLVAYVEQRIGEDG